MAVKKTKKRPSKAKTDAERALKYRQKRVASDLPDARKKARAIAQAVSRLYMQEKMSRTPSFTHDKTLKAIINAAEAILRDSYDAPNPLNDYGREVRSYLEEINDGREMRAYLTDLLKM